MRVSKSVSLIKDEDRENENGQGIGTQFAEAKRDNERDHYRPMRSKANRGKGRIAIREPYRCMKHVCGDEIGGSRESPFSQNGWITRFIEDSFTNYSRTPPTISRMPPIPFRVMAARNVSCESKELAHLIWTASAFLERIARSCCIT